MSKLEITSYGSDPEFLLINTETGKFVSSFGLIPGDKHDPEEIEELGKGFSIQKDNVLVELCVPPVKNFLELYGEIKLGIDYINNLLPDAINVCIQTTGEFDEEQLDNPFARRFGCEPSYNAWLRIINESCENTTNYRSAGFHIHFGLNKNDPDTVTRFIQLLDLTVGVPSVLFDEDKVRRKQYGTAGEFRPTHYGCEYRVLGGYVMQSRDNFIAIEEGINRALKLFNSDFTFSDEDQLNIQQSINTNNTKIAGNLIEKFNLTSIINKVLVVE